MEGIPFYRAREIEKLSDFGFVKNELYISEDLFVELSKSYLMPEENDIMVSAAGNIRFHLGKKWKYTFRRKKYTFPPPILLKLQNVKSADIYFC